MCVAVFAVAGGIACVSAQTLPDSLDLGALRGELPELVVKKGRVKYSKKNNPAVEFVNRLRKGSESHDPMKRPSYSYGKYEKAVYGLNDFNGDFNSGFLSKQGKFLKDYVDTLPQTGKRILPLMLKEKKATVIKGASGVKEITEGYSSQGVDESLSEENVRVMLDDALREVDIFGNDINLMQNRFVSPLSRIGPDYYRYYLTDTVETEGKRCVELSFAPHNPESMGFNGKIYVDASDTSMNVVQVNMRMPKATNLNYVENIFLKQTYETDSLGMRHKTMDDIVVEMRVAPGTPRLVGHKNTVYSGFSYAPRAGYETYYTRSGRSFDLDSARLRSPGFWLRERPAALSAPESRMGNLMREMRRVPLFYWGEKFISRMESGYIPTGRPIRFDIGPLNTMVSFNTVEGVRLRAGGMTMAALNPHLFAKGYGAWGTRDHRWKGGLDFEYSFSRKKKHGYEWPRHGFYAGANHDLDLIGQHYLFTNQDNVFLSLKRKESVLVTYRTLAKAGYVLELPNNFSVEAQVRWERQEATRWLPFVKPGGGTDRFYRQAAAGVSLRWAPGEKFVQGRSLRLPVNMDAWVVQVSQEYSPQGMLGASFCLNRTEVSVQKRLWFSAFGYFDLIVKGGAVWSRVPYPALMWPNANLSYTIQPESYSLMNPMEFANDRYVSADFTCFGNGILFNRLPWIKRLKMREVLTLKALKGSLSAKNNPLSGEAVYEFPAQSDAAPMKKAPYIEAGVGLDNILTFLRVDYVWRLTYRDTPGTDKCGVRVSLHFSF